MPAHWWQRLPKHRVDALSTRVLAIVKTIAARACRDPGTREWLTQVVPLGGDVETTLFAHIVQTAFQLAIQYHAGTHADTLVVDVMAQPALPLYAAAGRSALFGARGAKLLLPYVVSVLHTYAPVTCTACILAPLLALARLETLPPQLELMKIIRSKNDAAVRRLAEYFAAETRRLVPALNGPPTTRVKDMLHYCESRKIAEMVAAAAFAPFSFSRPLPS